MFFFTTALMTRLDCPRHREVKRPMALLFQSARARDEKGGRACLPSPGRRHADAPDAAPARGGGAGRRGARPSRARAAVAGLRVPGTARRPAALRARGLAPRRGRGSCLPGRWARATAAAAADHRTAHAGAPRHWLSTEFPAVGRRSSCCAPRAAPAAAHDRRPRPPRPSRRRPRRRASRPRRRPGGLVDPGATALFPVRRDARPKAEREPRAARRAAARGPSRPSRPAPAAAAPAPGAVGAVARRTGARAPRAARHRRGGRGAAAARARGQAAARAAPAARAPRATAGSRPCAASLPTFPRGDACSRGSQPTPPLRGRARDRRGRGRRRARRGRPRPLRAHPAQGGAPRSAAAAATGQREPRMGAP